MPVLGVPKGVSFVRILGVPSIESFLGGGLARGLYRPPPPIQSQARLPK